MLLKISNNKKRKSSELVYCGYKSYVITKLQHYGHLAHLKSWTLISRLLRNVVKKCFSADVPKVLIFGRLVRTGTRNDFSC